MEIASYGDWIGGVGDMVMNVMNTAVASSTLRSLVGDLEMAVRGFAPGQPTVDAVVSALRPALGDPSLLSPDQQAGDPQHYRQHLLHVADDGAFSLVALVWLPGQKTPIHDHLAWCVVGVHQGAEYEIRYVRRPDGRLARVGTAVAYVGDVAGLLPPGDIHRVHNSGDDMAISLHVYGADLRDVGSSIRRSYDENDVRAEPVGRAAIPQQNVPS
jgi:predicted metal-dependent enzyme (double-stranded beta helix superfamily)